MGDFSAEEIQSIIKDVVLRFSAIDNEVIGLNDVSGQDFSALNAIFKDHYSTSRTISDSITDILSKVCNLYDNELFVKLKLEINYMQNFLTYVNDTVEKFYDEVLSLNSDFKHVFIPALNFKQNISTLRLLLTNLKLNQGLIDGKVNSGKSSLESKLEVKIADIQSELPAISDDFEHLKELYGQLKQTLFVFLNDTITSVVKNHTLLIELLQRADKSFNHAKSIQNRISQKSKQGFDNLNIVVTNLQYHDIIQQKIEHVQITQRNILHDLNGFENEQDIIKKGYEYLKQIPGVTEIQAGQLVLSNKEYQNAIENSSNKLIDSTKVLDELIVLARSVFDDVKMSELFLDICSVNELFNESVKKANDNLLILKSIDSEIQRHLKKQTKQYSKLSCMEDQVSQMILDFNQENTPDEIDTIASKLGVLRNDIRNSKDRMGKVLNVHNNSGLSNYIDLLMDKMNIVASSIIPSEQICNFVELLNEIGNQITNNYDVYLDLDNKLKKTLDGIRYYSHCDIAVERIIQQLNDIYRRIKPMTHSGEISSDLIETMKNSYTMQSQYDIHDKTNQKELDENVDDDNLELF